MIWGFTNLSKFWEEDILGVQDFSHFGVNPASILVLGQNFWGPPNSPWGLYWCDWPFGERTSFRLGIKALFSPLGNLPPRGILDTFGVGLLPQLLRVRIFGGGLPPHLLLRGFAPKGGRKNTCLDINIFSGKKREKQLWLQRGGEGRPTLVRSPQSHNTKKWGG